MRIKQGFIKRKIRDKFIVIAIGQARKDYRNIIELNSTSSLIWDYISIGKTAQEIAEEFVKEFGISFEKALLDVNKIIKVLQQEGVVCD